jgi:hypothetical protein
MKQFFISRYRIPSPSFNKNGKKLHNLFWAGSTSGQYAKSDPRIQFWIRSTHEQ